MAKTVVITGATRGLGLSLSQRFLERGDTVYGISRTEKNWQEAKDKLHHAPQFHLDAFDLTSESEVKKWSTDFLSKVSKVDILINNAGYASPLAKIESTTLEDLERNLSENLVSAFLMSRALLPKFQEQKSGLIINVSSMAGKRSVPKLFAYSASKFGVVALSQCLAKENEAFGIKSFTVCPGGMNTQMRADLFGDEDAARQQTTDFVAGVMMQVIDEEIHVDSGGDIVIRRGEITAINPVPGA